MSIVRRVPFIVAGLITVACSGGGPTPEPPPSTAPPASVEAPTEPTAKAPVADSSEASIGSVIAVILDSRPMTMYLHPEVEGRVPVAITGPALAGRSIKGVAQGSPIVMRSESEVEASPEEPVVIFDRISITEQLAEVELRYPIEGIVARFTLAREGDDWTVRTADLSER